MKNYIIKICAVAVSLILLSCEGGFELDPDNIITPFDISLVSPENSELCDATLLESGNLQVRFEWSIEGEYAGEYTLSYTNSVTGLTETVVLSQQFVDLNLERGIRYSWNVSANIDGEFITADSDFITVTPGLPSESHPPYLSDIDITSLGGDSFQIAYSAIDPDGDAINYDVFIDTVNPPANQVETNTTVTQLTLSLNSNTTYYFRVIAKDGTGNETESLRSFTTL